MFVVINDDTYEFVNSFDVMRVEQSGENNDAALITFRTPGECVLSPLTCKAILGRLNAEAKS